ncbi:hypothetical protein TNCT_282311, partial [Trichonephila clavata]
VVEIYRSGTEAGGVEAVAKKRGVEIPPGSGPGGWYPPSDLIRVLEQRLEEVEAVVKKRGEIPPGLDLEDGIPLLTDKGSGTEAGERLRQRKGGGNHPLRLDREDGIALLTDKGFRALY